MNQVKQIFQLHHQGVSIKKIASTLGISKNTVKSYLRKTELSDVSQDDLMAMSNPILQDHLKPVFSQEKANYQEFLQRAEYYVQELSNRKKTHVTDDPLGRGFYSGTHSLSIFPFLLSSSTIPEKQASFDGNASSTGRENVY